MRRRNVLRLILVGLAFVFAIVFWPRLPNAASSALANADSYELLSIDPETPEQSSPDLFHGYRVLGSTQIADKSVQANLNAALRHGVESVFSSRNRCFMPRHGVRLTSQGVVTELLICFECKEGLVWRDGQADGDWTTDNSPKPAFDAVLSRAGVLLPKSDD